MRDWIDSLNKEQLENASLVAEAARKVGVPPHLAVSMAFAESGLKHYTDKEQSPSGDVKTSKMGAMGIMQLIPTTAAELKVDPKDRDQNILGGVAYLKKMLDLYQDPMLAAAAYNHGPEGAFFNGGELPKETKTYLSFIKEHGGFDEAKPPDNVVGESWKASPATGYGNISKEIIEGVAAAGGAGIAGTGVGMKQAIKSASQTAGEEIAKRLIEAGRASSSSAVPEVASAAQGLIEGSGPIATSPAGGKGTKNWAQAFNMADPEALRARDMKEANAMNRAAMAAEDKIKGLFGGGGGQYRLDPTRASLMVNQSVEPKATPIPRTSILSDFATRYPSVVAGARRVLTGGLGGFGGAASGMEAIERGRHGDVVGSGLAGVGALGSLLAIPAATAGFGVPLAVASGLGLGAYDLSNAVRRNVKEGEKWAEDNPPTQRELEEAKRAYFGRAR
jgi:Transglycosylase SLT domain